MQSWESWNLFCIFNFNVDKKLPNVIPCRGFVLGAISETDDTKNWVMNTMKCWNMLKGCKISSSSLDLNYRRRCTLEEGVL